MTDLHKDRHNDDDEVIPRSQCIHKWHNKKMESKAEKETGYELNKVIFPDPKPSPKFCILIPKFLLWPLKFVKLTLFLYVPWYLGKKLI